MLSLEEVNEILNGTIYGNKKANIEGPCSIEDGKKNHIAYIKNNKYVQYIKSTHASVIIAHKNIDIPQDCNKTVILVDNPSLAFIEFLNFYINKINKIKIGFHKSATIHKSSLIGENVYIGENVVIEKNVKIHNNVQIFSNAVIKEDSTIGEDSIIRENVIISNHTILNKRCEIKPGSVIGSNGFGLVTNDKIHYSIPHVGKVIIKDNVLIGSNCTIDRGTINDTVIESGTKFDNQVHIGHNVKIGKNCIICAQVGIGGSSTVGNNVIIGGQAGIIDHLKIDNDVLIGPKSYVVKSIKSNAYYSGNPARNHKDHIRQDVLISKLPKIYKKLFN